LLALGHNALLRGWKEAVEIVASISQCKPDRLSVLFLSYWLLPALKFSAATVVVVQV
jgi:hypothetical protein